MGAIPFHQLRVFAAGLVCGLLTCMAYLHLAGVRYYAVMDADLSRTPLAGPVRGARERPPARLRPHHSGIVGGSYAHLHGGPTLYVSHDRWLNVASIFTDDMVLQRGAPMCIWGWTSHEGMPVSVTLKDPQNRSLEVRSATPALSPGGSDWNPGPNPRWGACLGRTPRRDAPGLARARYRVEVAVRADGLWVALELRGVRFGDVYVCAGQSNVVFPSCLDVIPEDCPAVEPHPDVHVLSLAFLAKGPPLSDAYTTVSRNTVTVRGWAPARSLAAYGNFSALCYHVGRLLAAQRGVPVGLIQAAYPAVTIHHFLPASVRVNPNCAHVPWRPPRTKVPAYIGSYLWNHFFAPLCGLAVAAVVWYQGESDAASPRGYNCLLQRLVEAWRARVFRPADARVFVVSTHPFPAMEQGIVAIRNEQSHAVAAVPNLTLVPAFEATRRAAHPVSKALIAQRVASLVLHSAPDARPGPHGPPVLSRVELREDGVVALHYAPHAPPPRHVLKTHAAVGGPANDLACPPAWTPFEFSAGPCPAPWQPIPEYRVDGRRVLLPLPTGPAGAGGWIRYAQTNVARCAVYADAARLWPQSPFMRPLGRVAANATELHEWGQDRLECAPQAQRHP